jgi:apolipoprotein N-acyltransferase
MNGISLKDAWLAGLSGLMLTAGLTPIELDWIAWIALVPLLISLGGKSSSAALKLGLLAGLSHYLTLVYWIVVVLSHYGNINFIFSVGVLFLLCLYLALYPAFFALILVRFEKNALFPFWGASWWVALEYARAHIMTGFPWCLLGYSQYSRLPLIQISDVVGVYGLSFVIVLVNLLLYSIFFAPSSRKGKSVAMEIILSSLMIGCVLVYGYNNLREKAEKALRGKVLRAAVIQGNIDQSQKWNLDFQEKTLAIYNGLSGNAVDFKPQIIIWPETAVPFFFQDSSHLSQEVLRAARTTNAIILFGSPAYQKDKGTIRYYNRAYVVSEDRVFDCYDKVHLVPFGEYVPLKKYLPFVHRLVPAAGDFSPGREVRPISAPDLRIGVLICFEAIFPDISRKLALQGSELLVNITNDAWFGRTSAPYQHLSMAVFRCVENDLPMARAANTGISAFILASGKIVKKGGLFEREVLREEIRLGGRKTFYSQRGDIFAILTIVIAVTRLVWTIIKERRSCTIQR